MRRQLRSTARRASRAMGAAYDPAAHPDAGWELARGAPRGSAKDLACPGCIETKPEGSASCLSIDGTWCQTLAFRSFGSELWTVASPRSSTFPYRSP
jgi:hypothetical protein